MIAEGGPTRFKGVEPARRDKGKAKRMGFSLIEFKRNRRRKRIAGVSLFWGALAMLLLDATTNFPTPVHGKYASWWLIVAAVGAGLWIASKRLPLEQTFEISKYCRGELKVSDLTSELNVTIETAERIFAALERKGYAKLETRDDVHVWIFPEIKAAMAQRQQQRQQG